VENLDSIQTLIEATRAETEAKLKVVALLESLRADFSQACGLVVDVEDLKIMLIGIDRKLDVVIAWLAADQRGDKEQLRGLREKIDRLAFPGQVETIPPLLSPAQIRRELTDKVDEEELRTLCFDWGIDYDSLPGKGKSAKVRELVAQEQRHDGVGRLRQWLEKQKAQGVSLGLFYYHHPNSKQPRRSILTPAVFGG